MRTSKTGYQRIGRVPYGRTWRTWSSARHRRRAAPVPFLGGMRSCGRKFGKHELRSARSAQSYCRKGFLNFVRSARNAARSARSAQVTAAAIWGRYAKKAALRAL
jgi:hypothetical protein